MRRLFLFAVGAAALATSLAPALAADMSAPAPVYTKAPVVAPIYNWTGLYLGAHGGYGWGRFDSVDLTGLVGNDTQTTNGAVAGGQIGYNYQIGQWVLGIEGTYAWSDVKQDATFVGGTVALKNDYIATVAGRVGYAFDRILLYGKGGAAWTRDKVDASDGLGGTGTGRFNRTGFVAGGGVEYAFWDKWSARVEYNYLGFASQIETPTSTGGLVATTADVKLNISTLTFGVNYRF